MIYARYLIADYEHNNFSVSQCNWESNTQPHIVAIRPPGASEDMSKPSHKLSAGAIVGIVIGAIAGIIIATCLGIILWKRLRSKPPPKPKQVNNDAVEIDTAEKDPYMASPIDMNKGHPQSPELDVVEHKGHELDSHTYFDQTPTNEDPVELPATERQSRTLPSPISQLSDQSDTTKVHKREPSDPVSVVRARSDATGFHSRESSDPISPMRQRSDATRLHKRELSDPVSLLSERPDEGGGTL